MTGRGVSRRSVLRSVGAGAAGAVGIASGGGAGSVGGTRQRDDESVREYTVGAASRSVVRAARDRARTVRRVLDFGDIGTSVVGEFTDEAATALHERDDARYVQDVVELSLPSTGRPGSSAPTAQTGQAVPWGVDRIDADVAHANGHTGEGVHVAVLDSGIVANHPDLRPNLGEGRAFVDCTSGLTVRCTVDSETGRSRCEPNLRRCRRDWGDDVPQGGHGTHVAGTVGAIDNDRGVVGIAPDVTLHSVKVTNTLGTGPDAGVAAGVKYATDRGWDVVNMSLGGFRTTAVLEDAVEYAAERDVVLVAAAGNEGPGQNTVGFPGRHPAALAVSATSRSDGIARFSSRGANVGIAAPGADVCSTIRGGAQSSISGTSMATPHVAGVAALLLGSGVPPGDVRGRLVDTAEDVALPATEQGAGLVDAAAALGLDSDGDGLGSGVCNPPRSAGGAG